MGKKFSDDFKEEAIKLVEVNGVKPSQVAKELGIGKSTIEKWVRQYRETNSNGLTISEKAELRKLREENRVLKLEKELLKKATVFFAKNSQ